MIASPVIQAALFAAFQPPAAGLQAVGEKRSKLLEPWRQRRYPKDTIAKSVVLKIMGPFWL